MRGGVQHFEVKSVWDQGSGAYQRVQIARCGKCPHTCAIHDPAHRPTAPSVMADRFRRKGWVIAPRAGGHLCPRCAAPKPKPALTPDQKRAAFCRIAGVQPAAGSPARPVATPTQEAVMPAAPAKPAIALVSPPGADAPRQATREDRRRIMEALDEVYLIDRGCYAKNGSDKSLAERLGVPRAWVSEERDRAYGPDACEIDSELVAAIAALEARADTIEAEALALAERGEALKREAVNLRAKMSARGVS